MDKKRMRARKKLIAHRAYLLKSYKTLEVRSLSRRIKQLVLFDSFGREKTYVGPLAHGAHALTRVNETLSECAGVGRQFSTASMMIMIMAR